MAPPARKPNESRLGWYWRRGRNKLSFHLTQVMATERGRQVSKVSQDFSDFYRWGSQAVQALVRLRTQPKRRLLAIYDLSSQPFSIRDILVIQEASLVLREQHQLGEVDFAILCDATPSAHAGEAFAGINSEHGLFHLASVLPAAQVNPHLGSLLVFNSRLQLERFIADNADQYFVWPPAWQLENWDGGYFQVCHDLLNKYHQQHGSLPRVGCRSFLADWAQAFFQEHVSPRVPVTVQLRPDETDCTPHNMNMECWFEFIRACDVEYPVRFVVTGACDEIDERLRDRPNVLIARDHGTTIEQDLALIQTAAIHMGASSGPGTMAILNNKPYFLVNADTHTAEARMDGMIRQGDLWRLPFGTPYQHLATPPETADLLVNEFARMWSAVDQAEWKRETRTSKTFVSWLR